MMRNKFLWFLLLVTCGIWSCQKSDSLAIDAEYVKDHQEDLLNQIKTVLGSSEYGFVLYPESITTSSMIKEYSLFTLQFDTLTSKVTTSSYLDGYKTPDVTDYTLSVTTGLPMLVFATRSYISRIYATGDEGVTDFFFQILKIDGDTVKIRPYRKGFIFNSEGGAVFNLVKKKMSVEIPSIDSSSIFTALVRTNATASLANPITFGSRMSPSIAASSDVTVTIKEDFSLVDKYNQLYGTDYEALPSGTFQLTKNQTTIPSGSINSRDSFVVAISGDTTSLVSNKTYLLPLVGVTNSSAIPIGLKSVAYIVVEPNNVSSVITIPSSPVTLLSRTGWVASANSTSGTYVPANAIDNNVTSSWASARTPTVASPVTYTIDMRTTNTMRSIRYTPNSSSAAWRSYDIIQAQIYTSMDGVNWTQQGVFNGTPVSSASNLIVPDYKYINFVNPISTRYLRLSITKSTGALTAIIELNPIR
ncbi:MAG: hypothetical protein DI598_08590 [Pseudopedobacter saltans]|uniref:F5/8 type C domain-containing protein n=1 Tax=Pseudopedobacter saltans TaxID=151895 RepID=A0A2W5F655_9SPHI|nr:MAG: hypothetical protein DI598_08590 [Pseudopedobacter saltans]